MTTARRLLGAASWLLSEGGEGEPETESFSVSSTPDATSGGTVTTLTCDIVPLRNGNLTSVVYDVDTSDDYTLAINGTDISSETPSGGTVSFTTNFDFFSGNAFELELRRTDDGTFTYDYRTGEYSTAPFLILPIQEATTENRPSIGFAGDVLLATPQPTQAGMSPDSTTSSSYSTYSFNTTVSEDLELIAVEIFSITSSPVQRDVAFYINDVLVGETTTGSGDSLVIPIDPSYQRLFAGSTYKFRTSLSSSTRMKYVAGSGTWTDDPFTVGNFLEPNTVRAAAMFWYRSDHLALSSDSSFDSNEDGHDPFATTGSTYTTVTNDVVATRSGNISSITYQVVTDTTYVLAVDGVDEDTAVASNGVVTFSTDIDITAGQSFELELTRQDAGAFTFPYKMPFYESGPLLISTTHETLSTEVAPVITMVGTQDATAPTIVGRDAERTSSGVYPEMTFDVDVSGSVDIVALEFGMNPSDYKAAHLEIDSVSVGDTVQSASGRCIVPVNDGALTTGTYEFKIVFNLNTHIRYISGETSWSDGPFTVNEWQEVLGNTIPIRFWYF